LWDIDSIIRNNNAAVAEYFQDGRRVNAAYNPILTEWPLSILAQNMIAGPVNLKHLADLLLDDSNDIGLRMLSRKFLPEFEIEIMNAPQGKRVSQFCKRFSERYYELEAHVYNLSPDALCENLPVSLMGLSKGAYHDLDFRAGYLLLMSLVVYPWMDDEEDEDEEEEEGYEVVSDGGRIALLDIVSKNIGKSTVGRILPGGWTPEELHTLTDGTKYDGVGYIADWVCGTTGCQVLDHSYSDCPYIEGISEPYFKWSFYNVETLGLQWKRVVLYRNKIDAIVNWIEATPDSNFTMLVNYLDREYKSSSKGDSKRDTRFRNSYYEGIELECMSDESGYEEQQEEIYGKSEEETSDDGIDPIDPGSGFDDDDD